MGVVCREAQEERHDLDETAVFKVCLASVRAASVSGGRESREWKEVEGTVTLESQLIGWLEGLKH